MITLLPEFFRGPLETGILARARNEGRVRIELVPLREFGEGRHRVVDDYPFGGGAGMVMKPGPVVAAIEHVRARSPGCRVVLLTPQGRLFRHDVARELAAGGRFALVCGRYEGFDERIRGFCDDEISVGDYVLMGGEAAAWVVIEAAARFVPGVLGDVASPEHESLADGLLEYPQYTRPREFRGLRVPDVLVSGDHGRIAAWRRRQAVIRTARRRPDLLERARLSPEEQELARRAREGEELG